MVDRYLTATPWKLDSTDLYHVVPLNSIISEWVSSKLALDTDLYLLEVAVPGRSSW